MSLKPKTRDAKGSLWPIPVYAQLKSTHQPKHLLDFSLFVSDSVLHCIPPTLTKSVCQRNRRNGIVTFLGFKSPETSTDSTETFELRWIRYSNATEFVQRDLGTVAILHTKLKSKPQIPTNPKIPIKTIIVEAYTKYCNKSV